MDEKRLFDIWVGHNHFRADRADYWTESRSLTKLMKTKNLHAANQTGFSLIELIIAMTLTLVVMTIATTLIARGLNVRTRSNENLDALADAQRALNVMSREIAQAGFNLTDNGIVAADSVTDGAGNSTLRIRANLNKYDTTASTTARNGIGVTTGEDSGEDVKYFVYAAPQTTLLARYDRYGVDPNTGAVGYSTVLANRLDGMHIHYFSSQVTYSANGCDISAPSQAEVSPGLAKYVVI